jgi:hypothetical protein
MSVDVSWLREKKHALQSVTVSDGFEARVQFRGSNPRYRVIVDSSLLTEARRRN